MAVIWWFSIPVLLLDMHKFISWVLEVTILHILIVVYRASFWYWMQMMSSSLNSLIFVFNQIISLKHTCIVLMSIIVLDVCLAWDCRHLNCSFVQLSSSLHHLFKYFFFSWFYICLILFTDNSIFSWLVP